MKNLLKKKGAKIIISLIFGLSLLILPGTTQAALTTEQVNAILTLLNSFGADATTIANVQTSLTGGISAVSTQSSSSPTNYIFSNSPTLKIGDKGEYVKNLQTLIGVNPDGNFGLNTEMKVMTWQEHNGLTADGVVGPLSKEILLKINDLTDYVIAGPFVNANPTSGNAPLNVNFNLLLSDITAYYTITFGDGEAAGFSTTRNPSLLHTYIVPGTYLAIVTKNTQCSSWECLGPSSKLQSIQITVNPKVVTETNIKDKLPCNINPTTEKDILSCLTAEAQKYWQRSMEIRTIYPLDNNYKNLITYLNHSTVQYLDKDGYVHITPDNTHIPNPYLYGGATTQIPNSFYRDVKDCSTKETILHTIISSELGYQNYVGGDRYEQQCILDGSMDTYYVESINP